MVAGKYGVNMLLW